MLHRFKILRDSGFLIEVDRYAKNTLFINVVLPEECKYSVRQLSIQVVKPENDDFFHGSSDFGYLKHVSAKQILHNFSRQIFDEIQTYDRDFYFNIIVKQYHK